MIMQDRLPEYLKQGEAARLFPVLATTSKEGRTTSIVLACLSAVEDFGAELMSSLGVRVGKRARVQTYTEVVFNNQLTGLKDRPDGLIVVSIGTKEWRALVEAKVGNSELEVDQIERYRALAKDSGIDCVLTISNQFATTPASHPLEEVRKSRSKIPVYHWSWMHVLTVADLLINRDDVKDSDQLRILNELRRFLTHESAGVKGFDRMPPEWSDLNKLISSGGTIASKSKEATAVLEAWHQETRDLSLILTRMTEARVVEKLPRKHQGDPAQRLKDEMAILKESKQLQCSLEIPDAAAALVVVADIARKTLNVGMTLKAPIDRKSTKARVNWIVRQIRTEKNDDIHIRLMWPGASPSTQFSITELRSNPAICEEGKNQLTPHSFHVFTSKALGARFAQQVNFVAELENIVPTFYGEVGSLLSAWKPSAPKIKADKSTAVDVSTEAISDDAEDFEG